MNSTSGFGLLGFYPHTLALMVMVSLSLSLIAATFYGYLHKRDSGVVINMLGGLIMIPVIVSLLTRWGTWPQAYMMQLFLCAVLSIPTILNFKKLKENNGVGATRRL